MYEFWPDLEIVQDIDAKQVGCFKSSESYSPGTLKIFPAAEVVDGTNDFLKCPVPSASSFIPRSRYGTI